MFAFKPDYEQVAKRYEAWWNRAVLDRPLASIYLSRPMEEQVPVPVKTRETQRERWLDTEYQADRAYAEMANTLFYADALPIRSPNLGPEVFSAFYGCELVFGEETSWSKPILKSWEEEEVSKIRLDTDSFYFQKLVELTQAYIEVAQGKFIVGHTDFHSGGDAIAAFRDPEQLCLDMLFHAEAVKAMTDRVTEDFLLVYDYFRSLLSGAGMPSTSWLPAICDGKFHIPSNDFSCMISDAMFEEVFLPGIERECAHMDRSIYHLDGPNALRYLDRLLEIPTIHAIQWVPGSGRDDWHLWIDVYRRIQKKKKAFIVYLPVGDLEEFMGHLKPEGVWIAFSGISGIEEADKALNCLLRWK